MKLAPTLSFGRHILNQVENGIIKEWMETNGIGSYAMGTIIGANTRRYHSLFVLTGPQIKRSVMVNRIEESVLLRGRRMDCSCQEYPGNISPQGHLYLESFRFDPFPTWVYSLDDLKIEKKFFLRTGEETAVLIYRHILGPSAKLILRPFFSCRDQHVLIREDRRFEKAISINGLQIRCALPEMPAFFTTVHNKSGNGNVKIYDENYWYKNLVYAQEEERELDYQEDLFSPAQIHAELSPGDQIAIIFSDQEKPHIDLDQWIKQELSIREKTLENFPVPGILASRCAIAADQFFIKRNDESRILRGYPWHEHTIRECLMSLPGICLATNRIEEARSILRHCSKSINQGLLPHTFPAGENQPGEYHNMDASLWFIWSVQKFWEATKDADFLKEMKPSIEKIIQSFRDGIKVSDPKILSEIFMDKDGLVAGSSSFCPLTWMNGKVGDWMPTPRRGKPVEIQALWYNALQFCSEVALKFDGNDHGLGELAKQTRTSFNMFFWNSQNNYLYDVIDGNLREGSIRPNALYAISMPYEILENEKFKPVMETAARMLYSSLGLRTLAPQEPHFYGIYRGDEKSRVSAAHNGTVYPFLIGPFLTAYFKTYGREQKNKQEALYFLTPFIGHMSDAGLGTISEFFDGNPPFNPRGCIADALAVAEILRVMKEEGLEL